MSLAAAVATAGIFPLGTQIRITDRGGASFNVVSSAGETTNTFDVIALTGTAGKVLKLDMSSANELVSYGNSVGAFDAARERVVNNGTIFLDAVTYTGSFTNQFEELKGEGSATVIKADSATEPAMTVLRKTSSIDWDFYKFSDMTFDGLVSAGVDSIACVQFDATDAFSGRTIFDNVLFLGGERGVSKTRGHIGDGYYNCAFQGQDFGWYATSSQNPVMHNGAVLFQQTNFDVIDKACIYSVDNVDGPGGITVRDSLMQGCNGMGVFMNMNNFVSAIPPTFDNLWMEAIAMDEEQRLMG